MRTLVCTHVRSGVLVQDLDRDAELLIHPIGVEPRGWMAQSAYQNAISENGEPPLRTQSELGEPASWILLIDQVEPFWCAGARNTSTTENRWMS